MHVCLQNEKFGDLLAEFCLRKVWHPTPLIGIACILSSLSSDKHLMIIFCLQMMETIANCLATAQQDPSVNAVVIRNNGDHFCSGIDYSELIDCSDKQQHKSKVTELCSAIRYV